MYSIDIRNVSKKYRIYHDKNLTLKERVLFFNRTKYDEHQVLDDISLQIEEGKTVGLIGQNGSGKSTLLKLMTRIIYPDTGEIAINGKVSSLLELGAGFHPDFSGRENIYTNASIFGLTKEEIDKRFDQIVEFSELQEFIDNPVRTYSSGMYMRLAFSVAINVDADILLIDEILAVGDASFQKKCMDKIKELKRSGTTIVIVTHDTGSVEKICDTAVWLENGKIKYYGNVTETINYYLEFMGQRQEKKSSEPKPEVEPEIESTNNTEKVNEKRWGSGEATIEKVSLLNRNGENRSAFRCGDKVIIEFEYRKNTEKDLSAIIGIGIYRNDGVHCYGTHTMIDKLNKIILKNTGNVKFIADQINLLEGCYYVDIAIATEDGFPLDYIKEAMKFDIYSDIKDIGITRQFHHWEIE